MDRNLPLYETPQSLIRLLDIFSRPLKPLYCVCSDGLTEEDWRRHTEMSVKIQTLSLFNHSFMEDLI